MHMLPKRRSLFVRCAVIVGVLSMAVAGQRFAAGRPAYAQVVGDEIISESQTWYAGEQHAFSGSVIITNGATLTIERGVTIVFAGDYEADGLQVFEVEDGTVEAIGTEWDPIIFKKTGQNSAFSLSFRDGTGSEESRFRYVRIEGGGEQAQQIFPAFQDRIVNTAYARDYWDAQAALLFLSGNVSIRDSVFSGSGGADIFVPNPEDFGANSDETCTPFRPDVSHLTVEHTDFKGSSDVYAFLSEVPECDLNPVITLRNNWYGSEYGPLLLEGDDWDAKRIYGNIRDDAFSTAELFAVCQTCASNVLFLPGIKASRLYMDTDRGTVDTVWPPSLFSNDLSDLALDESGDSVNDVYTKDVLESAGPSNFYKSFVEDLEKQKQDRVINDFVPFAYDWRMNVKDVAYGYTPYPGDYKSLTDEASYLAQSSKTGKVTIVAHSNGGLVAKELLIQLEEMGETGLVDRVIFVGTPQLGTPISILSLLYGYNEALVGGLLASRKDVRALAENMPGAYGLLPSQEYFKRTEQPLISFLSEHTRYKTYRDGYGERIDDWNELVDFLTSGNDDRTKPEKNDVESENILNRTLLNLSEPVQADLDAWKPPTGVEAIQIAGWGLDTIRGVDYTERKKATCYTASGGIIPSCVESDTDYEPVYEPKFTVDGDAVVTAPSALMLEESPNVKKYWFNLFDFDDNNFVDRTHADILEAKSIRNLLLNIINHSEAALPLPEYISTTRPSDYDNAKPRIRMSLYSPLTVRLTDAAGNHTGRAEAGADTPYVQEIPGSVYHEFGERKYVTFPAGEPIAIELSGYETGSYTLKFEEVSVTPAGEETASHTAFEYLPVTPETTVKLTVPEEGLSGLSNLEADVNGAAPGGEYVVAPVPNGTATLVADSVAPTTTVSLSGIQGTNGWYTDAVTATLLADDGVGGSGIARTEYSFDDGATWNGYIGPIPIVVEGVTTLSYRSIDTVGNLEAARTTEVKIDRTAPEARIGFDSSSRSIRVSGSDNLSGAVTVTATETPKPKDKRIIRVTATLVDDAGHKTVVTFDKKETIGGEVEVVPLSVSYDGRSSSIAGAEADYRWFVGLAKRGYLFVVSNLQNASERLSATYFPFSDQTLVLRYPKRPSRSAPMPTVEWLSGLVIPGFETKNGSLNMVY
jgi:pimeloyl-ACP methyl ester carboxylesterase